ncbi:MAG: cbb3-type cytochrome oxidase assembly protein CcoS [Gammaproteobacteria bacterium HGW-Gammaproteobacteria-9]|jgi:cbb3-type cytochrome oxidase maturation protein|uniref:cbb3-type cytochrome oxidase assembly protein CcoS n=1 Tax=Pseudomonas sp. (strain SCT) TaxID=412955 RepID=UPI0008581455|nr:cbb3-type cytochrome oxidase assembly protein CcoS [Pseudomonas sp. SCT]OCX94075.1 MAG: cytochrome oxidase maturation protein, cbb3-type [Pseudomonas sp. CO183]PKL99871.1 MAG: cbb3-type cytochrome oxidase assembly protein CcoS [Gammaproteobacteria bacterium HGW-Gammaproteobacteria-9]GCA55876.1 cytochrome oxidase maturation protein cbb3-type [Pseudomonas sp. SCT]
MAALYILIPVAVVLVAVAIWVFFWAVNSGQFDDLDGPAHSILFDDEEPQKPTGSELQKNPETEQGKRNGE